MSADEVGAASGWGSFAILISLCSESVTRSTKLTYSRDSFNLPKRKGEW